MQLEGCAFESVHNTINTNLRDEEHLFLIISKKQCLNP